ncbi:ABC transporter ATP-binding protein [Pedobacter sp. UC225_61]|uniref:ABC transporter ATP-binding protein n=1 Tax=Pedobacter sp. UC225_61 TaxID=3374623 RepID=UPI0037B96D24
MSIAIKVENLSKAYQLGQIGTGTISRDLERWYARIRKKEDPFLRIGEDNNQTSKSTSDIVWSLRDINFEIEQGDAVGIIGRNGAGKSTLLKILSKITSPTTGKITGHGRIASLLEVGTGFHPELSGRENIFLNGAILGMRKKEIARKLDEIVEFASIQRYLDTPVKRYSSGMYVRLAFAVAAHLESEILIVDEVLAVGDAEFQKKCLGKMNEVSKGEGRTVLFVSHNMQSINKLCNRSILLHHGNIAGYDVTSKIIDQYSSSDDKLQEIHLNNNYLSFLKIEQIDNFIRIHCHYKNCENFNTPFLGFTISDSYNNKLFGTNPKLQIPSKQIIKSSSGQIIADIHEPKLLAGTYNLSVWFGDGSSDYFEQENILSIDIIDMGTYDVHTTANENGPIIPKVIWNQVI